MNFTELTAFGQRLLRSGLGAPILLMMMLGMMVIPLPPFLLDIFFTSSIFHWPW